MTIGALLPLVALEGTLRVLGPVLPGNFSARLYLEPHAIYGRFHIPNTTGWLKTDEYFARVDINSHGLREREIDYDKPTGARRVVVLGDSFVEGAEVPAEATLTRQLEALLNAGGGQQTQVINAGVLDFGTAQEYLLLKHEALRYSPDLVVLVFYTGNDVANNSSAIDVDPSRSQRPYFQLTSRGELRLLPVRGKTRTEDGLVERLRRESVLYSMFDTGVLAKLSGEGVTSSDENPRDLLADHRITRYYLPMFNERPSGDWDEAWKITEAILAAVRDETAAAGVPLLLVHAPTKWEVQDDDWSELRDRYKLAPTWWATGTQQRLADISARQGIRYLDLRPALRQAAATGPRQYFHLDVHWTTSGHEVVAQALASALR